MIIINSNVTFFLHHYFVFVLIFDDGSRKVVAESNIFITKSLIMYIPVVELIPSAFSKHKEQIYSVSSILG